MILAFLYPFQSLLIWLKCYQSVLTPPNRSVYLTTCLCVSLIVGCYRCCVVNKILTQVEQQAQVRISHTTGHYGPKVITHGTHLTSTPPLQEKQPSFHSTIQKFRHLRLEVGSQFHNYHKPGFDRRQTVRSKWLCVHFNNKMSLTPFRRQ